MKAKYIYIALLSTLGVVATSCVEYGSMDEFVVETPESVAVVAELNELDHLKNYIDRSAYPNLKLGGAVTASEYAEKTYIHSLVSANFDEIVAENAMKYKSVVADDGTMNFETIDAMIAAAEEAEIGVYGHVLCWHAYNNTTYLNSLLADRLVPNPDAEPQEAAARYTPVTYVPTPAIVYRSMMKTSTAWTDVVTGGDFESGKPDFVTTANNATGSVVDGVFVVENPTVGTAAWNAQVMLNIPAIVEGEKYKVSFQIKSTTGVQIQGLKAQDASGYKADINNAEGTCVINTTTDWETYETEFEVTSALAGTTKLVMSFGTEITTIYFDDILIQKETTVSEDDDSGSSVGWEELVENGDFEAGASPQATGSTGSVTAGVGVDGSSALVITNDAVQTNDYDVQFLIDVTSANEFADDDVIIVSFDVRGEGITALANGSLQSPPGSYYNGSLAVGNLAVSSDWQSHEFQLDNTQTGFVGSWKLAFNIGKEIGTVYIDNVSVLRKVEIVEPETAWINLISNGDFDGTDTASVVAGNNASSEIVVDNGSNVLKIGNSEIRTNNWDAQIHFRIADSEADLEAGKTYKLSFKVKSDNGSTVGGGQFQSTLGGYIGNSTVTSFNTSTEWTEVTMDQVAASGTRAVTFCIGNVVDNFYLDDCFLGYEGEVTTEPEDPEIPPYIEEPLTDEEKTEAITGAMEEWIKAMMEHTSYVKVWDVINEPIQDDNPTELRNGTDSDTSGNNFYWNDYMGKDYVRTVVALARQYGGDDLILFANDYGLQWYHDDASGDKLAAFLDWVEYWEEDGITKIDGLGTQMHLTYPYSDEERTKFKAGITDMFERMAATGKYIKISELDIVMKDASDTDITSASMSYEDYFVLADLYEFIIQEYLKVVPAAQQYGINHWTFINNSSSSEWRGGYPAGLWASTYERTLNYAGYVNGLQDGAADFVIDAVKTLIAEEETLTEE